MVRKKSDVRSERHFADRYNVKFRERYSNGLKQQPTGFSIPNRDIHFIIEKFVSVKPFCISGDPVLSELGRGDT